MIAPLTNVTSDTLLNDEVVQRNHTRGQKD